MEDWKPLVEAAREIGISPSKLSGLVQRGKVSSRKNPYDERVTLVDMEQLRRMFPPRKR